MVADPRTLIDKLNPACRGALERAAAVCVRRTHYGVETEHLLAELLESPGGDVLAVLRQYDVDPAVPLGELALATEKFQRGNGRTPSLSPHLLRWLERGWLVASLRLGEDAVRPGALLLALLDDDLLRAAVLDSAPSLGRIPRDGLRDNLRDLLGAPAAAAPARSAPPSAAPPAPHDTPRAAPAGSALARYTVDLTAQARAGRIDPIRGRDGEIRQIVDILMRRRQNNPILTGEAGVGKTAVVEGFALRVAGGSVPPALRDAAVLALDLGALQAGAGVRGEFENRVRSVIEEVGASPAPVILFIDEAHTLIGAGGAEGQGDAANLLKPALARGELRTVAATTWSEYKRYVEKDPALARRFQVVRVDEPDEDTAVDMLRGVAAQLERHHGVRVLDEALRDAVRLSHRHMPGRQLPDKAIGVLDTACARVAVAQHGAPVAVEAAARRMEQAALELAGLRREAAAGADHAARLAALEDELDAARAERALLEDRWRAELERVREIVRLRAGAEAGGDPHGRAAREVAALEADLEALQGEEPLVPSCVDSRVVAAVIAGWTGIPLGKILKDEIRTVLGLRHRMADRVIGQPEALDTIARRIRTFRASLDDPGKPVGVFLLVGPSGVGKTETALTLADHLYGGERNLVVVNMSEYQEAHTVSALKGAPPGYVGYGRGGILTEAVRRRPYSVVLLDEVEKAHPDVMELFYQVFDKGRMEDGEGVSVDFRNTLILLTSNVGSETVLDACRGGRRPGPAEMEERIRPELLRHFPPALLGRLTVVPYFPLADAEIREIVELKLAEVQRRFWESHGAELTYDDAVAEAVARRCTETDAGARNVDHIVSHSVLPELSTLVLERMSRGEAMGAVHLSLAPGGGFAFRVAGPARAPSPLAVLA
ncbi:MAG TPA: type VI secretion system ATPase TssH [Longimicrobiaceae bacterium]|jgi:type VI secretion system protein VasG